MTSQMDEEINGLKDLLERYELSTETGKVNLFKNHFAEWLEDDDWKDEFEPDEEEMELAREWLAKEYYNLALPVAFSTMFLIILILIADYFLSFQAQVYEIFLSLWAAPASIFPSLKGADVIASTTGEANSTAEQKVAAQNMAMSNVVLIVLLIGFTLQLLAVEFLARREFLTDNLAVGAVPNWTTGAAFILIAVLTMLYFRRLRGKV